MEEWATRSPKQPKAKSPHWLLIGQGSLLILLLIVSIGLAVLPQISCIVGVQASSELGRNLLTVDYFNGERSQGGLNVGRISGTLLTTTIDSLGWNGAPFTWVDTEEREVARRAPCHVRRVRNAQCQDPSS
jgi:hypothetical protein